MSVVVAEFDVLGLPAPKGSHSGVRRGDRIVVLDGSSSASRAKLAAWEGAVRGAARSWMASTDHQVSPWEKDTALAVHIIFRLPAPKRTPRETLQARLPDLDKLERSTHDALKKSGLIHDDSRIAISYTAKRWTLGDHPGAEIYVYAAEDDDIDDVIPCFAS